MLREHVEQVVHGWVAENGWRSVPEVVFERPSDPQHGDYALPFCMELARIARRPPRDLAEELRERLAGDSAVAELVDSIEVAGPGFLNFRMKTAAFADAARRLLEQGEEVGRGGRDRPANILLEYVSVNPNGPLHVGHGRYAAYGDSLCRILRFSGHEVTTEFYINDYGRQMEMFGRSVAARYAQSFGVDLLVPEEGYHGEYVADIAERIREEKGDVWVGRLEEEGLSDADSEAVRFFRDEGCRLVLEQMKTELEEFGVAFDHWFSETPLHEEGRVREVIDELLERGAAYEADEAVWLRTTEHGDDKDRVLVRSNERPTYFAADIAYHRDKLSRGYDHLINIWGADHHGYVLRMQAAIDILAGEGGRLEVIIGQLVSLVEDGRQKHMSTRRGELVTLAELIEAIGVDAARFFLVMRSHDQPFELDVALAREQSQENPVYYVQYAHARIASIIRNLPEGLEAAVTDRPEVFASPYEQDLIKRLDEFGSVVLEAADRRAPHRVVVYAQELASDFHVFYKNCRVIGSAPDVASARLALCLITRRVVARCLALLGVSAPESM